VAGPDGRVAKGTMARSVGKVNVSFAIGVGRLVGALSGYCTCFEP
jgi:hypothetical protein